MLRDQDASDSAGGGCVRLAVCTGLQQRRGPNDAVLAHCVEECTPLQRCSCLPAHSTGHGLRPIDVAVMKKLSDVVNVVPVIAKSDSLTLDERDLFKERVSAGAALQLLVCR